ncbi:hypothetical protein [Halorarum salinum]|uniref:Uncharacterized protein n=1 Tax=Halorarum salinum TaxID=2743089 RepID=A0A7D5LAJ6_9EURY|nr:hypothetical protein [Halobaculum salinum]QLG62113.1 hypothetical protein HUG12_10375 [Halobaculum salinum]
MTDTLLHALSVPFALVAGTGAGVLAVLSWRLLRGSPLGTVMGVASAAMAVITAHHAVLLVMGPDTLVTELFGSGTYTAVAVLVAVAIRGHRRRERADAATDPP